MKFCLLLANVQLVLGCVLCVCLVILVKNGDIISLCHPRNDYFVEIIDVYKKQEWA